jgi:hypothetical protein
MTGSTGYVTDATRASIRQNLRKRKELKVNSTGKYDLS